MEPTGKKLTFDEMPGLLAKLLERFDNLSALLRSKGTGSHHSDWMDIDQLRDYLPGQMARSTIYDWVKRYNFPHYQRGKALYFLRPEVDAWLKDNEGRSHTLSHSCGNLNKIS